MQSFVEFNEAAKCNKEENDKDLPFTPDVKKTKPSTAGKYGSAYSTVRNLARQAMQKQAKKTVKEEGGKITVDEETLIEKTNDRQKLRDALDRHTEHAIAANKRGDDEAVKVHQGYINKIKTKMAKLVQNEELTGKQGKLDVDKDGKIEGEDLTKLRKMKKEEVELEEEQLDELKKSTLASYIDKAAGGSLKGVAYHAWDAGSKSASGDKEGSEKAYAKAKKRSDSIQTAAKKLAKEESELDEASKGYAPGWMLKADPELAKKVKEKTQGYKDLKKYAGRDIPKKEELDMKTFSQFMEEIEQIEEAKKDDYWDFKDLKDEPKSNVRKIAGKAYGGAAQKDDDDEDHPVANKATEKRGRGRPKGSTSGARTAGAAKKSYGGLTFHSLNLPNSNK